MGHDTVHTREPGGTTLGEGIRELFLNPESRITGKSELMLMLAARAQHVQEVIRPALKRNAIVITDRFTPSTLAYQGVARALGLTQVQALNEWATGGLKADLTIILDAPTRLASERLQRRDGTPDRLERDGRELQTQVRHAYRQLAKREQWRVLDARHTALQLLEQAYTLTRAVMHRKSTTANPAPEKVPVA